MTLWKDTWPYCKLLVLVHFRFPLIHFNSSASPIRNVSLRPWTLGSDLYSNPVSGVALVKRLKFRPRCSFCRSGLPVLTLQGCRGGGRGYIKTRKHVVLTQEARYVLLKYLMLYTSYVLKTSVGPAQWGKCLPSKQEDLSSSPRTYIKWARCGAAQLYSQL